MPTTFTHEMDFRQERDFGQKISAAFEFIGAQGRPLSRVLLYLVVPAALLSGILLGIGQITLVEQIGAGSGTGILARIAETRTGPASIIGFAGVGITYLLLITTLYEYVRLRMTLAADQEVTPALVWQQVQSSVWWVLLCGIMVGVITGLGFLLIVVPGVYFAVALSPFFVIMIIERNGFSKNFSRSTSLVSGYWWNTLGLLVVMQIIQGFLGIVVQIPMYVVMGLQALHLPLPAVDALTVGAQTFASIGQILLYIPTLLAILFQYFNLVEIKDGLGMHRLVEQIGQQPVPVAATAYRPDEEGEY